MKRRITKKFAESVIPTDKPFQIHDTAVPGLVLRVQPTGNKIWKLIQNRKPRTLGRMPAMTHKMAEAKALAILRGEDPDVVLESDEPPMTFGAFVNKYYDSYVDAHHSRPKESKSALKSFGLHDTLLDEVKLADIEIWRIRQTTSKATINRKCATLHAALEKAVEWEVSKKQLTKNPLQKLKPLKIDKRGVIRYLEPEEATRLNTALLTTSPWLRTLVTVALNTGLRRGELWNLRWSDVNLKRSMLTVHGKGAKSGQTRHIPLNSIAMQALKDFQTVTPHPTLPVFGRHEFKRSFATLLKNAEITEFRFHDLRHSFASNLVSVGVPLNTVRELMGHATLEMTLIYAHLNPVESKAAVDLLVPTKEKGSETKKA